MTTPPRRPLPHRLPCELLWVEPVAPPPVELMMRVVIALRGMSAVPDSISILLIRHWMRQLDTNRPGAAA
ncbi:hypothetical protein [Nocardia wallacei]|uniref:hypothetical protein n=1 Tax=Nocardia wallacei TaxID=480035 RepID=UPI00245491DB|nr:hypothetical protein [Nocardia wallacei]